MREGTDKYDDTAKGGYSYAEKLALVQQEAMDPKEIGMKSHAQARGEEEPEKKEPIEKLGDFCVFEASVVPPALRAKWAREELTVVPGNIADWEATWCEQHKNEYAIQSRFGSGTVTAQLGQLFTDPILGFAAFLRKAADLLEEKYTELKKTDPNPVATRDELAELQKKD